MQEDDIENLFFDRAEDNIENWFFNRALEYGLKAAAMVLGLTVTIDFYLHEYAWGISHLFMTTGFWLCSKTYVSEVNSDNKILYSLLGLGLIGVGTFSYSFFDDTQFDMGSNKFVKNSPTP